MHQVGIRVFSAEEVAMVNLENLFNQTFVKGESILQQPPSYTVPEGKLLILHDMNAPAAKQQGKTWIHWIQSSHGTLLPYTPPSPPDKAHTYRFILADEASYKQDVTEGDRIGSIPVGEERGSFIVKLQSGGKRSKRRTKKQKTKKSKTTTC